MRGDTIERFIDYDDYFQFSLKIKFLPAKSDKEIIRIGIIYRRGQNTGSVIL